MQIGACAPDGQDAPSGDGRPAKGCKHPGGRGAGRTGASGEAPSKSKRTARPRGDKGPDDSGPHGGRKPRKGKGDKPGPKQGCAPTDAYQRHARCMQYVRDGRAHELKNTCHEDVYWLVLRVGWWGLDEEAKRSRLCMDKFANDQADIARPVVDRLCGVAADLGYAFHERAYVVAAAACRFVLNSFRVSGDQPFRGTPSSLLAQNEYDIRDAMVKYKYHVATPRAGVPEYHIPYSAREFFGSQDDPYAVSASNCGDGIWETCDRLNGVTGRPPTPQEAYLDKCAVDEYDVVRYRGRWVPNGCQGLELSEDLWGEWFDDLSLERREDEYIRLAIERAKGAA